MNIFLLTLTLSLSTLGIAYAVESPEHRVAERISTSDDLNTNRLMSGFSLSDDKIINDLRTHNLENNDIGIVLSLAEQMPGGITEDNVNKIMNARSSSAKSWNDISTELKLDLTRSTARLNEIGTAAETTMGAGSATDPMRRSSTTTGSALDPRTNTNSTGSALDPRDRSGINVSTGTLQNSSISTTSPSSTTSPGSVSTSSQPSSSTISAPSSSSVSPASSSPAASGS